MASLVTALEVPAVSIGRTLERAFDTVRHHIAASIAFAFLLGAVPAVGFQVFLSGLDPSALILTVAGYALPGAVAIFFLEWFVGTAVGALVQGAMIVLVLADEGGINGDIRSTLHLLLRGFPSLVGLALFIGFSFQVAVTLLVIPAVLLSILWSVAPSALVAEGEGMFMALSRSQELTQGARLKIFGLMLLVEFVDMVVTYGSFFAVSHLFGISMLAGASAGYIVTMSVLGTLINLMWGSIQASLYVELQRWKEGGSVDNLEQVFA